MGDSPDQAIEVMVAFVGLFDTAAGDGLVGAAMVTNERGYPLEFRVSTPVRPTAVQKALYGGSLETYVETELVGRRLATDLQRRPAVIIVNRLGALGTESPAPLVAVVNADEYVEIEGSALSHRRLEMGSGSDALAIVASQLSPEELGRCVEDISIAARHFDLLEAFDRMKTALDVLAQSDERYR